MKKIFYAAKKKLAFGIDTDAWALDVLISGNVEKHYAKDQYTLLDGLQLADASERTHYDAQRNILYLDGAALIDLQIWLLPRKKWRDGRQFQRAFEGLFFGGSGIQLADYPRAAVLAARNVKLPGELSYFQGAMIAQNPDVFHAYRRGENSFLYEIELED